MKARPHLLQSTGYRPGLRRRIAAALLAAGIVGSAMPARALDSSPAATIAAATDVTTGTQRVLTDVRIAYPGESALAITIGKLTIRDFRQADGGFQAGNVSIEKIVLTAGGADGTTVEIPQATFHDVAGPPVSAAALSAQLTPGRLPPVATFLLAARAGGVDIPRIIVRPSAPAAPPLATYTNVTLDHLDSGKAAGLGFDSLDSKAPDGSHLTIGKSRISDLDFGAYAAWLDDALAAAAPPQMRQVYSTFELDGLAFADASSSGTIDRISGADFKLAPPAMKPSDLAMLFKHLGASEDYAGSHPADMVRLVRTLLSAFTLGNLRIDGLVVNEDEEAPVSIGLLRLQGISGSGIGEIRFGDVSGTTRDEKAPFALGSVALRDLAVTDLDPMLDMLAAGGQPADLSEDQYPKVRASGFALADFSAEMPGKGEIRIGGFTIDAPDWVGLLPSTLAIHLGGLSSPLANIDDPESRATFEKLGLKVVEVNADVNLAWKEADQTLAVGPLALDIGEFSKFEASGIIGNVPRSVFVTPAKSMLALFGVDFRGASLHVEDSGGIAKLIALSANEQKISVEQLALGSTLLAQSELGAVLGDANAKKIGEAIQAFILKPEALTIDVKTSKPLPIVPLLGGPGTISDSDMATIRDSVTIDARPE